MKKSAYKVYPNPLEGYKFSFAGCHAAEIGAYVIGIIIAVLICTLCIDFEEKEHFWRDQREGILYAVVFSLPLLFGGLSMTLRTRKVKKIMTDGVQTEGEIISYCRIHIRRGKGLAPNKPNYTILNVKFHHNDGDHVCSVNVGHKKPKKVLNSAHCTVYICGDTVFVTDFDLRKKGDPQTDFQLEEQRYE